MGSDRVVDLATLKLGEFFAENEPFYLSIGMSHEEYWNGEPQLARLTLRAFNLKQQRDIEQLNYSNWLLGSYIESAVASAIGNAFSNKKQYVSTYTEEPYDLFPNKNENEVSEREIEKAKQESLEWLIALTKQLDKQFNT